MVDVLATDAVTTEASAHASELHTAVRSNMQEFLLYGIPKGELEDAMMGMFRRADTNGSGVLDKQVRARLPPQKLEAPVREGMVTHSGHVLRSSRCACKRQS